MYASLDLVKLILRDDYLRYPSDITDYAAFAEMEIDSRLAGQYSIPFDDTAVYATVPTLIQWIYCHLVGYKMYDERTSLEDISNPKGQHWWDMAQKWLAGIVEGDYLLSLADGTVVVSAGSTTGPRSYPEGLRDKAPSADNVPYFTRAQAGEW